MVLPYYAVPHTEELFEVDEKLQRLQARSGFELFLLCHTITSWASDRVNLVNPILKRIGNSENLTRSLFSAVPIDFAAVSSFCKPGCVVVHMD